jgi:hypothetical protein
LIQGNFIDSYHNLTYKHVMALKWFVYNCPEVNYLLKADDDILINTPLLYNTLEASSRRSNFLFCNDLTNSTPVRSEDSKWFLSREDFPDEAFPDYCSGFTILFSADVVFKLYTVAQSLPYFWIDDLQVTGFARSKLNISISSDMDFFWDIEENYDPVEDKDFIVLGLDLDDEDMREAWKKMKPS